MIQIGGVYTTFCQEEGIFLQKSIAIEMGGVSRFLFKSIRVGGRFDSPEKSPGKKDSLKELRMKFVNFHK